MAIKNLSHHNYQQSIQKSICQFKLTALILLKVEEDGFNNGGKRSTMSLNHRFSLR